MDISLIKNRIIKFEDHKLGDINHCPFNWKIHTNEGKRALAAVVEQIGWAGVPVVYHSKITGGLTFADGHRRKETMPDLVVTCAVTDFTDEEVELFLLTYDPLAEETQTNVEILGSLFQKIKVDSPDLREFLGRMAQERGIVGGNGDGTPPEQPPIIDKAEELQKEWKVKFGDIWQMGNHRLICGDCREPETWKRLLDGQKVNGVFTSPPYAEQRKKQYGGVPADKYVEWWEAVQENVRAALADDGSFFVNIKPHSEKKQRSLYVFDLILAMVRQYEWLLIDELCWKHWGYPQGIVNKFKNCFEPIYHFGMTTDIKIRPDNVLQDFKDKEKPKRDLEKYGAQRNYSPTQSGTNIKLATMVGRNTALPGNVIEIPQDAGFLRDDTIKDIHSATFPIKLPTFFIKAYSDPNDIWLDPFCGSGTTIIAANNEGRIGYGIEKLEKYCAVILQRYLDHTGKQPQLLKS